jgi:hypothetical protein
MSSVAANLIRHSLCPAPNPPCSATCTPRSHNTCAVSCTTTGMPQHQYPEMKQPSHAVGPFHLSTDWPHRRTSSTASPSSSPQPPNTHTSHLTRTHGVAHVRGVAHTCCHTYTTAHTHTFCGALNGHTEHRHCSSSEQQIHQTANQPRTNT